MKDCFAYRLINFSSSLFYSVLFCPNFLIFVIFIYSARISINLISFRCCISLSLLRLQVVRQENTRHIASYGTKGSEDLIVCINDIKMSILAKSVLYPGTSTLIFNLLSSFADDQDDSESLHNKLASSGIDTLENLDSQTWQAEYNQVVTHC